MNERARPPAPPSPLTADPWHALASHTPARLALGRAGASLPSREVLRLGLAHAQARDAVHAAPDAPALVAGLEALGLATIRVESAAPDRAVYLRRPDLGRRLSEASRARLAGAGTGADVAVVVADGLSASAIDRNVLVLLGTLLPLLRTASLSVGPVAVASQARVALGDEIGAALAARLALVLVGERPGLSAADSLGAYLTFAPRVGRTDAERNCVSNIRPLGLPPAAAAGRIAWLCTESLRLGLTGVALKDGSDALGAPASAPAFGG